MADFVQDFISECIDNGFSKPTDIIKIALEKRNKIDEEIEKICKLKEERDNLQKVLKVFNYEDVRKPRRIKTSAINNELNESEKDPSYMELIKDVVDVVESANRGLTSRELIVKVGYDGLDPSPIYMAIKWLFSKLILKRDLETKIITKGSAWEERNNILNCS